MDITETVTEAGLSAYLAAGSVLAGSDAASAGLFTGVRAPSFPGIASDWVAVRSIKVAAVEFASRALSGRERARSAAVVAIAAARLADNIRSGQAVRQDNFFSAPTRCAGDEFAEAVLAAACRDPEEAKIPHYGALFANVACHSRTEPAHALLLAKLAAEISHRQFVLLALVGHRQRFELRSTDYVSASRLAFGTVAALHELTDLERRGLLLQAGGAIGNPRDLIPAGLTPVGLGEVLVKRLGLNRVDGAVLSEVAALLA